MIRYVERFQAGERLAHWIQFLAFTVLLGTGLFIFLPALQVFAIGPAGMAARVTHRIAAVVFIASPLLYLISAPGGFFRSVRDAFQYDADDWLWMRKAWAFYAHGKRGELPEQGKYNAGQKLNALTQIITFVVFVVTGVTMWFFRGSVSPSVFQWFVLLHDLAMIVTVCWFLLHLYLVAIHPLTRESILAMVVGSVTEQFAAEHHGKWLREVKGEEAEEAA